jgi:D-alanine-D-alanine ligase
MKVGLTFDLRAEYLGAGYGEEETAEFDRPDTIDALERAVAALGHAVDRIGHVRSLVSRLAAGDRWDLVFNICEGMHGIGRESQVPALLDAYEIPYTFSDPLVNALTLHKAQTKRVLRDLGLPTPDFAVVSAESEIAAVDLPFPLFAKPVAEGTGKGVTPESMVRDRAALGEVCRRLLGRYRQPVLVETYLPGREFTTGVLGTGGAMRPVATMEIVLLAGADPDVYTYANKESSEERCRYELTPGRTADEAAELAVAACRGLGCRDASRVDLRADASGRLSIMEVNSLPGLHPWHSDLPILAGMAGLEYGRLIGAIMKSASERIGSAGRVRAGGPGAGVAL